MGQSYGAAIATLMARLNPRRVRGLVLLSGYYAEPGPTARWLLDAGGKALSIIPRDLRNAVLEVTGQPAQFDTVRQALAQLDLPIHVVHGDKDDFAPLEAAERLVAETRPRRSMRFARVDGADHFLNDGPTEVLLEALDECLPPPLRLPAWRLPKVELPDFAALAPSLRNLRLWPQPAPRRGMKTADA